MDVNAVCVKCGKDMEIQPAGDFVNLICPCGFHKSVNLTLLRKGGKDTQPIPVVTKGMSEEDIHRARERLMTETTQEDQRSYCKYAVAAGDWCETGTCSLCDRDREKLA